MDIFIPISYLALMAFAPLSYATFRSISREKLKDSVFVRLMLKEYLRTLPTIALVSLPLVIFPSFARVYVIAIHLIFMWLVILELGHIYLFGSRVGINTFYSLFVSNAKETIEYIRTNQTKEQWVLISLIYLCPLILIISLMNGGGIYFSSSTSRLLWAAALIGFSIPLIRNFFKSGYKHKLSYNLNPFISVFYHYFQFKNSYGKLKKLIEAHAAPKFENITSLISPELSQTLVVVIGESANLHHHAYDGYARNTNEYTHAFGDFLNVKGVRSRYAQTLPSLEKAITFATDENPEPLWTKGSIIDYFVDAGFKTFWLSNQYALDDAAITAMAEHADVKKYFNFGSMKGFGTAAYDGAMLDSIQAAIKDAASRKIIFVHLIGSHSAYTNRYPAEFRHFKDDVPGRPHLSHAAKELINAYDDSIRYTDWLIASIAHMLKAQNDASSLLYFADHGEDCYDTTDSKMLGHAEVVNEPMSAIPLQIWMSETMKSARPDLVKKWHATKPAYQLENIVHTIIELASLRSPDFQKHQTIWEEP